MARRRIWVRRYAELPSVGPRDGASEVEFRF